MPSIEQCDGAGESVAALQSTLEIFDKFKPLSENGKDSDSEESFHLLLDEDDIESQSVVSNGRDKEILNEETEDDILNKFETLPSGTPDNVDPQIEDSILNDGDDEHTISDKENDPTATVNVSIRNNTEKSVGNKLSNIEVKITYGFKEYENTSDGEFKSIYETDAEASAPSTNEETPVESNEKVELMDVSEESDVPEKNNQNIPSPEMASENVVDSADNFEDCMEIEQEEAHQDIANIIEHLEDQDSPMEDSVQKESGIDVKQTECDVNMKETSDTRNLSNEEDSEVCKTNHSKANEETLEKDILPLDDDVEMSGEAPLSSTDQGHEKNLLLEAENADSDPTFRKPVEMEKNQEESSGYSEVQVSVDNKTVDLTENEGNADDEKSATEEQNIENNVLSKKGLEETTAVIEAEAKDDGSQIETGSEKETNNANSSSSEYNNTDDALLRELEETIKESDKETNEVSQENSNQSEDVFKVPEEIRKEPAEQSQEVTDVSNVKSNNKTEEDETDLLDISMIRETEEDDACAIADAIEDDPTVEDTDKETQASEKSDEEQSDKIEMEQEGSDNDNTVVFDDLDDDTRLDDGDSSMAEADPSVKSKEDTVDISESSKDSISDSDTKKSSELVAAEDEDKPDDDDLQQTCSTVPSASSEGVESPINKEHPEVESIEAEDKIESSDLEKTDEDSNKAKENSDAPVDVDSDAAAESEPDENGTELRKLSLNKRSHSITDLEETEVSAKKPKLTGDAQKPDDTPENPLDSSEKTTEIDSVNETPTAEKLKTLTAFSKFMKCRKLTAKLSRSDLEQFCIQKICESLMLKSTEGELHQTIKKQEKTIDNLRKDILQLSKQCKDLEIVNKKLMSELRNQNAMKKPLVPLKITRSVGLQVRLNPGNEIPNQNRRRQPMATTPQKQVIGNANGVGNRGKVTPGSQPSSAVRQVMQTTPQKSPLNGGQTTTNGTSNSMLTQALQKRQVPTLAKRTPTPVRKPGEASRAGVIDLTDEDDKLAKSQTVGNTIKIINKTGTAVGAPNKNMAVNKMGPGGKTVNQNKQVAVSKAVAVGQNKGSPLSQGIRLAPASVITSSANGSPQMVYVVPTITSSSGGQQKVAFVNFQPTNGVLSGAINGSTVSVMSNKQGQTLTLKTVPSPLRHKHPAPLPTPPRINLDPKLKPLLPKPLLTIKKIDTGIILQWKMPYNLDLYESIASYQLYAYQETSAPPSTDMWRKVGDVKALALPMACTLTQFADKNKYYFAVRSVDVHKRIGAFSEPEEISL